MRNHRKLIWNHRKVLEIIENHEIIENQKKTKEILLSFVEIIEQLMKSKKNQMNFLKKIENHRKS